MQTPLFLSLFFLLPSAARGAVPQTRTTPPAGVMELYGKAQAALGRDETEAAKGHARELVATAEQWLGSADPKIRYFERVRRLRDTAREFSTTGDRKAFGDLSEQAIRYVDTQMPLQNEWNRYVCKTSQDRMQWMQPAGETKAVNPYGGDKTCAVLSPWLRHRQ